MEEMIANNKASIHRDIPDTRMRGEGYHHLNEENYSDGSGIGQFKSRYATTKKYRRNQEIEIRDYKYACLDDFQNDAKQLSVRNHQRGRAWDRNLI